MITLDDGNQIKSLSHFGLLPLKGHRKPISPAFTHKSIKIPGRDGLLHLETDKDASPLEIPVEIIESDRAIKWEKLLEFKNFLCDDRGTPKELKLRYDFQPDVYIKVMLESQIIPEELLQTARFTLNFTAYDSYYYSNVMADEVTWGSEDITFTSSYLLGHEGSTGEIQITGNTSFNVNVSGLEVYPEIEIRGSASSLKIETNGIAITLQAFNGTYLISRFNAILNGTDVFVDAHKFKLIKGENTISITGTNINASIYFKIRDQF